MVPLIDRRECLPDIPHYQVQKSDPMVEPNVWPSQVGFKHGVAQYCGELLSLARRIVRLMAKVLGLPENHFDAIVTYPGAMLRLLE